MALEYRKFKLLNGKGDEYTLTEKNFKVFGANPQGLGYSKTLSSIRLGDESFIYYQLFNLDDINIELMFYDDALSDKYQKYFEFVNFVSLKPLYLLYQRPNSFTWFRRRVEIGSLNKTEVNNEDSILHCPMVLSCLSFWEDENKNVINSDDVSLENGKIYPIEYPIVYGQDSLSNMQLVSVGLLESPLEITIDGTVTDPMYILYNENNQIYGRGRFIGTFDKVYVNSRESEEEIQLIRNGLVLDNPLGFQDLTIGSPNDVFVTFLKLQTGRNKISFFVDDDFTGSVKVEWRNRYVSV